MNKNEENKSFNIFPLLLVLLIIGAMIWFIISMLLSEEKYLSSENITVVSNINESKNEWDNVEKITIKTIGIAVADYSFDGGINWQNSNEYYATEKETLVIVVRDVNGKQTEPMRYETMNIDSVPPVISVKLPNKVLLNSKINLVEYVSATDDNSGLDGTITMKPSSLDTSKVGKQTIHFSAKDKAGNISNIDVTIEIVKSDNEINNKTAKVYYRYRVKNVTEYDCKTYDCSYYEDGVIHSGAMKTKKCSSSYNQKLTFNNGCYIVPAGIEVSCTQAITTVDRYSEYEANDGWTYVIDIIALGVNGQQLKYTNSNLTPSGTTTVIDVESREETPIDGYEALQGHLKKIYKAAPCGDGEISINGFCHAICSGKKALSCDEGYTLINDKCQKRIEKTCTDTCSKYTWSEWSDWSETVISPSDTIQVETKIVNE